jgi:2-oxoglutarate ferredoxin oxidoreductase subunit alpha
MKHHGVKTFQAEDEIAAVCAAIGASYAGDLGMTSTSGPGVALKTEALGLAVSVELPLIIVNVQRGGPSTGLPTKTEQADLLQALFGRNGEAPMPIVSCSTPADAFDCAMEAVRIATQYMTPVFLLTDGFIANGAEPWLLPDMDALPKFKKEFRTDAENYQPYSRDENGARPWVKPGTPGLEHRVGGIEKAHLTGNISYDPDNHEFMTNARQEKVMGIADSIPTPEVNGAQMGELLVLGWGSTYGSIADAVERTNEDGDKVGRMHLRHIWPLPHGLEEIFARYKSILIPEMNLGQLARLLRSEYPKQNFLSYPKVKGQPFRAYEIEEKIQGILENQS